MTTAPRKTAGMLNLERQLDEAFPDRQGPDGWIGDSAHRARTSSHNPDDTPGSNPEWDGDGDSVSEVRAVDVSSDLGWGVSSRALCDHLAKLSGLSSVVRYFIHLGLIWHERNGFKPVAFDGDPHPTHIHVTFAYSQSADNNTTFNYRLEDIPVRLTPEDIDAIADEVTTRLCKLTAFATGGGYGSMVGNAVWGHGFPAHDGEARKAAWVNEKDLRGVADSVAAVVVPAVPAKTTAKK